ncbi:NUDIX hydrolase N-terminal domain-containing protein [Halosimplex salinum]|uniref:NUDIX hydrolase N-terminal domain-containing protein n=1 Tax=Halosimplex salinum TaxID=1710538 RepID=UPI000F4963B7|nr:NUDIX hydrolase N-terminal domain-containing protein [Halosimplex salinum]
MTDGEDAVDLLPLLDEFRAMAQTGLHYADDPYEEERYERMLDLVAEQYGETFELPPAEVRERLAGDLGEITPKIAAIALVFDDEDRLLVIERTDGLGWCPPGGKLDLGETPAAAAERETREETGLEVDARELVDTYAVEPPGEFPHYSVSHVYRCEAVGGELTTTYESRQVQYMPVDEVPEWSLAYYPEAVRDALKTRRDG